LSVIEEPVLTPDQRALVREAARHTAHYRLFDNDVTLAGNLRWPLERFARMYFMFAQKTAPARSDITVLFHAEGTEQEGTLTFLVDEQAYRIADPLAFQIVWSTFMHLILRRLDTHFVFHAGCVARDGRGIAIAGASGMGKSTLVSHLASTGLALLSDELVPFARKTHRVCPFPARVGIREGPAMALIGNNAAEHFAFRDERKRLLPVEALAGQLPSEPVALHAAVFLSSDTEPQVRTPRKSAYVWRVAFATRESDFERALLKRAGVRLIERSTWETYPALLLRVREPAKFHPEFQALVERHGAQLISIEYEDLKRPDYAKPPKLTPLPGPAGVLELVKKMPAAHKTALIEREFGGKMARLVAELSAAVHGARFYKLRPGRIHETVNLVEELL